MAGDWLAACKDLPDKPEVIAVANATGMSRMDVAAFLVWRFWSWADAQTADGFLPGVTAANLAEMFGTPGGFWEALAAAGWLEVTRAGVRIPNFGRWMGQSAKQRLIRNRRQARWREGRRDGVDASVGGKASTKASTTEQNRREQKKKPPLPPLPGGIDTPRFRGAWEEWLQHRREKGKPVTATHAGRLLAKLAAEGEAAAVARIERAVANGWQGLFFADERPAPQDGPPAELPYEEAARRRRENEERRARARGEGT